MKRLLWSAALALTLAAPAFAGTIIRKDPSGEGYNPCQCICVTVLDKVVCVCLCDG